MPGSAQPEDRLQDEIAYAPLAGNADAIAGRDRSSSAGDRGEEPGTIAAPSNENPALDAIELDAALQLLVERAQYITGATGTALALPDADDMVCRASAGSCAPAVGARLQVRSGLTAESISRRQLLRCDNAETDPRVNLEACRTLGIASIVVLPLLRRNGDVRGLFELFSDHAYAFEERDLIALERMADLTVTALDLAEQRQNSRPAPKAEPETFTRPSTAEPSGPDSSAVEPSVVESSTVESSAVPSSGNNSTEAAQAIPVSPEFVGEPAVVPSEISPAPVVGTDLAALPVTAALPAPAPLPEAMLRVQKCSACGFPVSEGRTLCLDCEKKDYERQDREKRNADTAPGQDEAAVTGQKQDASPLEQQPEQREDELLPAFLANSAPVPESWLANHVNLLAIIVLILGVLVAFVVFR